MNIIEFLKEHDYYIEYLIKDDYIIVKIHWTGEEYYIKYNEFTTSIISSYKDSTIALPEYAVKAGIYILLNRICDGYKYPIKLVVFHDKDLFPTIQSDLKSNQLLEIIKLFCENGLTNEIVQLAYETDVDEGLFAVLGYALNVEIYRKNH